MILYMKKTICIILLTFITLFLFAQEERLLAFPAAEGYGKYTVGGRGGKVYEVSNLNDSGEGSFRSAVEASGSRIVVFRISGIIDLKSRLTIRNPYITIAGQTAPGDGICIKGYPVKIATDEVIIRHIRVRLGDENGVETDAIGGRNCKNIILDHISASWSIDETLSLYHCDSITVQWCIISESLYNSNHSKGTHGYGGIWGGNYSTFHHNLIAHHSSRTPRFVPGAGNVDFRNNVIYNWGYNSCYGGEKQRIGKKCYGFSNFNIVGNYYKPGPATYKGIVSYRIVSPSFKSEKTNYGKWYVAENYMEDNSTVIADNWNGGVQPQGGDEDLEQIRLSKPWNSMPINYQSADEAYHSVLNNAGTIFPKRDTIDRRIVKEVRTRTATFEGITYKLNRKNKLADSSKISGIIDSQTDVGGWSVLKSGIAPLDTDHDGMPDEWEKANGLDFSDPNDRNKIALNGYTYLEKYLNSLCDE